MPSVRPLRTPPPRLPGLSSGSAAVAWATPWLVWSAALVVAVLTGPDVSVGPVLAAVPALAAIGHRWPGILGFGVLATVTQTVLRWGSTPLGGSALPMVTIAIVVVTVAGVAAAVARARGERTLDHVRSLAGGSSGRCCGRCRRPRRVTVWRASTGPPRRRPGWAATSTTRSRRRTGCASSWGTWAARGCRPWTPR
ncbi:hypothetical protein GCM10009730_64100 [Streptomyces albidochromogenes]